MGGLEQTDLSEAKKRLNEFLSGKTDDRIFAHPTCHPSSPTGFCACDGPLLKRLWFYTWAGLLELLLSLPFNRPKLWFLRRLGATIGNRVYISAKAWIDPLFPMLLTIEDDVFVGVGAKIATHEFRIDEFRAGKVIIRKEAMIGAFSIIGCGVEIGERATVAAGAIVGRDVPPGATIINAPRIVKKSPD